MTAGVHLEPGHALYEGRVWHHRRAPEHRFTQGVALAWLDLEHLDDALSVSRLLSTRAWSPARMRRADYLGDPSVPLADAVRDEVDRSIGVRPTGGVHLLANLRTWGWCFNPLAVYWCGDAQGRPVAEVLAVTNTPWKETHCYVVDRRGDASGPVSFAKAMHVSPFLPMDLAYTLDDAPPTDDLRLTLTVRRDDAVVFDAGVVARRRELDAAAVRRLLLRNPTVKVSLGIHLHALRLWRKGARFLPHPTRRASRAADDVIGSRSDA